MYIQRRRSSADDDDETADEAADNLAHKLQNMPFMESRERDRPKERPMIEVLSTENAEETQSLTAGTGCDEQVVPGANTTADHPASGSTPVVRTYGGLLDSLVGSGPTHAPEEPQASDSVLLPSVAPEMDHEMIPPSVVYGFADKFSGFFQDLSGESVLVIDLPAPDRTPATQRAALRTATEDADFDANRFISDTLHAQDDMILQASVDFVPYWESELANRRRASEAATGAGPTEVPFQFSDDERDQMQRLPKSELIDIPAEGTDRVRIWCGLVGVLFGHCYDELTTQGDDTVESAWTIAKLSPALSWLDTQDSNSQAALAACCRRAATYPYLRNWDLIQRSCRGVCTLLALGRRFVLRALLRVRSILQRSETQYLLNPLFINHYCQWIQSVTTSEAQEFGKAVRIAAKQISLGSVSVQSRSLQSWLEELDEASEASSDDTGSVSSDGSSSEDET